MLHFLPQTELYTNLNKKDEKKFDLNIEFDFVIMALLFYFQISRKGKKEAK